MSSLFGYLTILILKSPFQCRNLGTVELVCPLRTISPTGQLRSASSSEVNQSTFRHSSRKRPSKLSINPLACVDDCGATRLAAQTFRVTHTFHPSCGHSFQLVAYENAWGEDRVYKGRA